MAYKNRLLLTMAAAVLAAGITATAFAAPGNFSVQADELEYDLGSGEAVAKGNAINSMVAGVTGAAGDLITTGQQRYQDNQQISAIVGSNEKNNLKYMIDAGYVPDKSQLEAVLSSASTDEEKKYYTNVLSKLYPKTRLRKNSLVAPTATDYGIKLNDNSNLLAQ